MFGISVTGMTVLPPLCSILSVECRLRVVDLQVDRDVAGPFLGLANAAADAAVPGGDHPVLHGARSLLVLPPEDVAVELLQLVGVLAGDLEPRNRIRHRNLLVVEDSCLTYDERGLRFSTSRRRIDRCGT